MAKAHSHSPLWPPVAKVTVASFCVHFYSVVYVHTYIHQYRKRVTKMLVYPNSFMHAACDKLHELTQYEWSIYKSAGRLRVCYKFREGTVQWQRLTKLVKACKPLKDIATHPRVQFVSW